MDAHASFRTTIGDSAPEEPAYKMPFWGVALLAGTTIFFCLMLGMVSFLILTHGNYS
jgi:hypothetical protein